MSPTSSSPPARLLLALLAAAWPLPILGVLLTVAHLRPAALSLVTPGGVAPGADAADPRRDPSLSLLTPGPVVDALALPQARFQYRRFVAATRALSGQPADSTGRWRHARDGSLYTYRVLRMELTPAALASSRLPDL